MRTDSVWSEESMEQVGTFLVPSFFDHFSCKGSECINSCCEGWDVQISQDEYFRLIGMEVSEPLRARLSRAFYLSNNSNPETYAYVNHDWQGRCPMRAENGLCLLQMEAGEEVLPGVCRLYPRSIRKDLGEITVANSCEAVLELLFRETKPIRFEKKEMNLEKEGFADSAEFALRMQCIGLLQDRSSTVEESMMAIGSLIAGIHPVLAPFEDTLPILRSFCELYEEISPSLQSYCQVALQQLDQMTQSQYRRQESALVDCFPNLPMFLENLLVNHFFYEKFPYSETTETEPEEFVSICGLWGFLKLLLVTNRADLQTQEALITLLSKAFRMMEHTRFHHNAHILLREAGWNHPQMAVSLIQL